MTNKLLYCNQDLFRTLLKTKGSLDVEIKSALSEWNFFGFSAFFFDLFYPLADIIILNQAISPWP